MPCTTILVGKKASFDGSTMIARNDDGLFDEKKLIVVNPKDQPRKYKSKIGHLTIELPDNPMRYTSTPNVNPKEGVWPACGINEVNVAMTATETITSNPRVLSADPYVEYKAKTRKEKEVPGGIGEEDLVLLVLPYIKSAREGVLRLGSLLEQYGTYESNGIAFSDENEIWWLETIGGHRWIAARVRDEEYVIMPNQFGLDRFDFEDAYGKKQNYLCAPDLKQFVEENHLDLSVNGKFNPRLAFGSHSDADHIYNTPRAWYMARYFNPRSYKWEGDGADFTPESDDIPWSLVPERKITVEDVKYILSSYYQGTPFNPYSSVAEPKKGIYRPIAVANTDDMSILQIRPYVADALKGLEWICFGGNAFNVAVPLYTAVSKMPEYVSETKMEVDTNTLYWSERLINALADAHYGTSIIQVERYQRVVANKTLELIKKCDKDYAEKKDPTLLSKANEDICALVKKETTKTLGKVLADSSAHMKNRYNRGDN